MVQSTLL